MEESGLKSCGKYFVADPLGHVILSRPVKKCGMGLVNPCDEAPSEYLMSKKVTARLTEQIQMQFGQKVNT